MERAIDLGTRARELRVSHMLELHRELFRETPDARRAGKIRESQNWIGGHEDSPMGASFVPPPEDLVPELLEDLCTFLNRQDMPAVVQAALAHAQFETIHPFFDGTEESAAA
jgi:Fic family protein